MPAARGILRSDAMEGLTEGSSHTSFDDLHESWSEDWLESKNS
jgi:hypothetical protein